MTTSTNSVEFLGKITICPITRQPIHTPAVASDGHFYEETAIRSWLRNNSKSPVTRQEISTTVVIPHGFKELFDQYFEKHPELAVDRYLPIKSYHQFKNDIKNIIRTKRFELIMEYSEFDLSDINRDHFANFNRDCIDPKIINYFLDHLIDIKAIRSTGYTIIHYGVAYCSEMFLEEILKRAGDMINNFDNDNHTPLMVAVDKERNDHVKLLLKYGALLDLKNDHHNTALHVACSKNNFEVVKLLVETGADLTTKNKVGKTCIEMCDVLEIKSYLLEEKMKRKFPITIKEVKYLISDQSFAETIAIMQRFAEYEATYKKEHENLPSATA